MTDWPSCGGRSGVWWTTAVSGSLWTSFRSMKKWCLGERPNKRHEGLNRSEAALVTNIGLVIRREEHFSKDALEFAKNT